MTRKKGRREGGFTMIELIIVIVILGILAAVAVPKFLSFSTQAELGVVKGVTAAIRGAVQVVHTQDLIANISPSYTAGDVALSVEWGGIPTTGVSGNTITAIIGANTYTWTIGVALLPTSMATVASSAGNF